MSNVTKPDALDMLRDAIKEANHPFGVSVYNANQVIAALEAEQQEARAKTIELVAVLGIRNLAQDHVAWKKLHELMALLGIEDEE